ncbi:MAG: hypothetical protein K6E27_04930 [Eubacterium sp.]|nr:hypothetical protein [Eubacterium sp.]
MSLINCPECNNMVSDKSVACPYCGFPICNNLELHDNKKKKIFIYSMLGLFTFLLVALVIIVIKLYISIENRSVNDLTNNTINENDISNDLKKEDSSNIIDSEDTSISSVDICEDEDSILYGFEKVSKFYWSSNENDVFVQTDDIYITQDSEGNYCLVTKLDIVGDGKEKVLMPRVNIFLCQEGSPYEGVTHSGSITRKNTDLEAYNNYLSVEEYLYPTKNGQENAYSVYPIANFISIASYDLEDTFQICVEIIPGEIRNEYYDDQIIKQYMEIDHLEVR